MSFPLSSNMFITPSLLVPPSDSLLTWCHGPRWDSAWRETACHVTQVINELWTSGQSKLPPNKRGQHKQSAEATKPMSVATTLHSVFIHSQNCCRDICKKNGIFQMTPHMNNHGRYSEETEHLSIVNKQQINTEQQKLKRTDMANHIKVGGCSCSQKQTSNSCGKHQFNVEREQGKIEAAKHLILVSCFMIEMLDRQLYPVM